MNILISDEIFRLQARGGISTLWRNIIPRLMDLLPECTFDPALPADIYLPTYYSAAPQGVPSIVTVYDWIHEQYPRLSPFHPDAIAKHRAVLGAAEIVSISAWTAHDTQGYTGRASTVVYPATDLKRATSDEVATFQRKYNLPPEYILIVGNRGLYKNVSTYWQACKLFNAPLTVCIGGEPEPDWHGVRHLTIPADDLAAAYTGALCLVYPSLYEGFGLPVLEAYACGCPVVCGTGGALAEINSAAAVVDVTRPIDIAQGIARVLDPSQRIEFILKGYEVARAFSWDRAARQYAEVIQRVLEGLKMVQVRKPKIRLSVNQIFNGYENRYEVTDPPRYIVMSHDGRRFANHIEYSASDYPDRSNDDRWLMITGATPEQALELHAPSTDEYDILPDTQPITKISITYENGRHDTYYSLMDNPIIDALGQFYIIYGLNATTIQIRITTINKMVIEAI